MTKILFSFVAVILFVVSPITYTQAQSLPDISDLVTKNDKSEFDVQGATKIDHIKALELQEMGAIFIDVRRTIQYDLGHIPGAIGLELKSMLTEESLASHVTKDQMVVFYCSDHQCYRSADASAYAITWGYTNVQYFAGGWAFWVGNGYDRETGSN